MSKFVSPKQIVNFTSNIENICWHNVIVKFPDGNEKVRPLRVSPNAKGAKNTKLYVTVSGAVYPVKPVAKNVVEPDLTKAVSIETVPATHKLLGITRKTAEAAPQKNAKKPAKTKKAAAPKEQDTQADAIQTLADQLGVEASQLQSMIALLKA